MPETIALDARNRFVSPSPRPLTSSPFDADRLSTVYQWFEWTFEAYDALDEFGSFRRKFFLSSHVVSAPSTTLHLVPKHFTYFANPEVPGECHLVLISSEAKEFSKCLVSISKTHRQKLDVLPPKSVPAKLNAICNLKENFCVLQFVTGFSRWTQVHLQWRSVRTEQ